jgi:hypothetical protein
MIRRSLTQAAGRREGLSKKLKLQTMFIARQSNHIQEDLKRGWSSWNFGLEGFEGTEQELKQYLNSATDEQPVYISALEIYASAVKKHQYGELYPNYWVVKDKAFNSSLAVNIIPAKTKEEAIQFIKANGSWFCGGDGDPVDTSAAKLVWSDGDIHILEIED